MKAKIEKLAQGFADEIMRAVMMAFLEDLAEPKSSVLLAPKPRGMAELSPARRRAAVRKAAITRARNAAARASA